MEPLLTFMTQGELLAHILNGVINRPVRDALLLHHALTASRKDDLRRELLISRLVRFHWEAAHMQAVKKAYRDRYGRDLPGRRARGHDGPVGPLLLRAVHCEDAQRRPEGREGRDSPVSWSGIAPGGGRGLLFFLDINISLDEWNAGNNDEASVDLNQDMSF